MNNELALIPMRFFYGMIQLARPARIVEIGSGFSSAACIDVNKRFFDNAVECTLIDPDTRCLNDLMREEDQAFARIKPHMVQEVPLSEFSRLAANDILFIELSHVAKAGSDVNFLFSEVVPALRSGFFIHFHDIGYPFEYPKEWNYRGWVYSEGYVLRTFLQFNKAFRIVAWLDCLKRLHAAAIQTPMQLCRKTSGNIWLQRN